MSGRQRLDRGDPRDDVVVDLDVLGHRVEDPQRAVVQRRVAPRQEGADAVGREFAFDGVGPDGGPRRMPVGDGLPVVVVLGARRVGEFDEPVAGLADEPLADLSPQRHQIVLRFALVHREEHLGVVERADGLRRHVVGVACPDTDDVDQPHVRTLTTRRDRALNSKYPVPRVLTSFAAPPYL